MFRPVRGLSVAVSVLVWLYTVGIIATTVWLWLFKGVYDDYVDGVGSFAELSAFTGSAVGLGLAGTVVFLACVVVTIVWLWRARVNAELINPRAEHRWGRGAVIWGWLPIVSFWVPRRVVLDVVRAGVPGVPVSAVNWWWGTWLASLLVDRLGNRYSDPDSNSFDLDTATQLITLCALLTVGAAISFLHLVRTITAWQSGPATHRPADQVGPAVG